MPENLPRRRAAIGIVAILTIALSALGASPAQAAAPAAPTLVSPASGSTSPTADVPLSVVASDPDGGPVDVTFEGRVAGATVPGGSTAAPFSIVVIPDTQNYTNNARQGTIIQQTQWAADSRATLNTAFVVQVGDLVNDAALPAQWGYTSAGFDVLDAAHMPYSVVPGNHDFDNATGAFPLYDQYFPPTRFSGWTPATAGYGGYLGQNLFGPDPIDRRNMDNFSLFSAGGRDFLVLNLEWEAPSYALDWARKVLDAYPDRIAILATHSFLTVTGERRAAAQRIGGTSQLALWTDFVSQECSIDLVVSGHEHAGDLGESRRVDDNVCGEPVNQVLSDYQERVNGGDGWLRYYTFDPAANTMTAKTYSPKLDQYETDADSAFTVPFALSAATPAPFQTVGTATVDSGQTARTTWTALRPDTRYEWRAVVRDGTSTTISATWTVRTPPALTGIDDTFTRSTASGWGTTDTGQQWVVGGAASSYSVSGGRGLMTSPIGVTKSARLATVSVLDSTVAADVAVSPAASGSGTYLSVLARVVGNDSYRAKLKLVAGGGATIALVKVSNGAETSLRAIALSLGTLTAGTPLRIKVDAVGTSPTTLRAKVWLASAAEPAAWSVTTTDSTPALQAAGSVGIDLYQSSSASAAAVLSVDRFTVGGAATPPPPPPPPANVAPTAAIATPVVSGRAVSFDGSGSTDADGSISAWSWAFGDGTTATGAAAAHTYAADGTFTATLTVTDDDGATATATRTVTVAVTPPPPPPAQGLVQDDFTRVSTSGWGAADVGGTWSTSGAVASHSTMSGTGVQRLAAAGGTATATLASVGTGSTQLNASISWSRTAAAGAMYASVLTRAPSATSDYRVKVVVAANGRPDLVLVQRVAGTETTLARVTAPGVTVTAGSWYSISIRTVTVGGTTTLSAKLWPKGQVEPATWQVTASDSTAPLQTSGGIGLSTYRSSGSTEAVSTAFDDLRVTAVTP